MKLLSILVAFAVLVPSADAAIIRTTKQKKLPTIANLSVEGDLRAFGFDVVKAPTMHAYDIWGRLVSDREEVVGKWFVRSMKLRNRSGKVDRVDFKGNLGDFLRFSGDGTYEFTLFACPANVRTPTEKACASTSTTVTYER